MISDETIIQAIRKSASRSDTNGLLYFSDENFPVLAGIIKSAIVEIVKDIEIEKARLEAKLEIYEQEIKKLTGGEE